MRSISGSRGILQWRRLPTPTYPSRVFQRPKSKLSKLSKLGREARGASEVPSTPARTRFAPSPTGWVHIGGLRTALYNYLLAKKTGGQFILRIEDTDQNRLIPGSEKRIYDDLRWAGLLWDEGPDGVGGDYGPYKQSERLGLYTSHVQDLIDNDKAYRCFCKPAALEALREQSIKNNVPISYPGTCSHIPPDQSARRAASGEEHCVRFRSGATSPSFTDLVYGESTKNEKEDDFIIIKRDGFPTYHFANVVDDHLMQITHVIRGAEWLISTPRHISLYNAFNWSPPQFAHVGLLMNKKLQKLSKRQGGFGDVDSWRAQGYLPEALLNHIMLLGWGGGGGSGEQGQEQNNNQRSEVMDLSEMIEKFTLKFTRGNTVINDKAQFFQGEHIRRIWSRRPEELADRLAPSLQAQIHAWKQGGAKEDNIKEQKQLHLDGEFVPEARPPKAAATVEDGKYNVIAINPSYAKKLILFSGGAGGGGDKGGAPFQAFTFLSRHAYLVWTIPKSAYEASIPNLMMMDEGEGGGGKRLVPIVGGEGDENTVSPSSPSSSLSSLSQVTKQFIALLEEKQEEEWDDDVAKIKEMLGPAARTTWGRVNYDDDQKKIIRNWGWNFLRWVVLAGQPGPAVFPSMVLLGKEETLRRFRLALDVAEEWEAGNNK